jgi:hypothetical protein
VLYRIDNGGRTFAMISRTDHSAGAGGASQLPIDTRDQGGQIDDEAN